MMSVQEQFEAGLSKEEVELVAIQRALTAAEMTGNERLVEILREEFRPQLRKLEEA
jgi:hypothetical protein